MSQLGIAPRRGTFAGMTEHPTPPEQPKSVWPFVLSALWQPLLGIMICAAYGYILWVSPGTILGYNPVWWALALTVAIVVYFVIWSGREVWNFLHQGK